MTKAKTSTLRYLPDVVPGYRRVRRGRGYCYVDSEGNRVTDHDQLERFRALVIPPAWKEVWISPSKKGHLQATGIDEDGRKQYRYHPEWTKERQDEKLKRMVAFGQALPLIRRQVAKDLRRETFTKEKAIAVALRVTEETLIRIGNEQYLRRYGSHGLTTLKKKHVTISAGTMVFRFRGKKGVWQEIAVRDAKLAATLADLCAWPGAYVFQYRNGEGGRSRLYAADINAYIQQYTQANFSSKDFRTWYAGLWAFRLFAKQAVYENEQECQTNIVSVLDAVSQRLGNTRAVCKQYYVPDSLICAYRSGALLPYLGKSLSSSGIPATKKAETQLLAFFRRAIAHPV
ncbi:DNA topoisomerase IB [Parapedobacter sp. DT-150]|uniref:DNA topoisomerase IB n=1 Tax=Parapedobacter sp. DT-150 TaxID=3396162 RepID=UPI003F1C625A